MDPGHALDLADLVDHINTDVDPLVLLVRGSPHPVNHLVGDIHAGHEFFHVAGHAQGTGRGDPGQDGDLLINAQIADHLHEFGELLHVIDDLGLDKIGAIGRLFPQSRSPVGKGLGKGVGCAAQKEPRLFTLDLLAALEPALVAQRPHHTEHLDGVHVKDPFGARMVAELLVITGQAEQVLQPQGRGAQDIALHPDPVPVAAGHLDNRLHPLGLDDQAGGNTGHPDNGGLTVGDIDRVHMALQQPGLFAHHLGVAVLGRSQLTGYRKISRS